MSFLYSFFVHLEFLFVFWLSDIFQHFDCINQVRYKTLDTIQDAIFPNLTCIFLHLVT